MGSKGLVTAKCHHNSIHQKNIRFNNIARNILCSSYKAGTTTSDAKNIEHFSDFLRVPVMSNDLKSDKESIFHLCFVLL